MTKHLTEELKEGRKGLFWLGALAGKAWLQAYVRQLVKLHLQSGNRRNRGALSVAAHLLSHSRAPAMERCQPHPRWVFSAPLDESGKPVTCATKSASLVNLRATDDGTRCYSTAPLSCQGGQQKATVSSALWQMGEEGQCSRRGNRTFPPAGR